MDRKTYIAVGLVVAVAVTLVVSFVTLSAFGFWDTWPDLRAKVKSEINADLTDGGIPDGTPAKPIFTECYTTEVIKLAVTYSCQIPKREDNAYESIVACLTKADKGDLGRKAIFDCFEYTIQTLQSAAP